MKQTERKKLQAASNWLPPGRCHRPYYNTRTGDWKCLDAGNPGGFEDAHGDYWSSGVSAQNLIAIRRRLDVQARLGLPTRDHTPEFPAGFELREIEGCPDYYYVPSSGARAYFFYVERNVGTMEDVVRGGTECWHYGGRSTGGNRHPRAGGRSPGRSRVAEMGR